MSTSDRVRVSPDGIQFFEPGMVHKATLRNYGAVDADTYLDLPTTSGTLATQEYVAANAGGGEGTSPLRVVVLDSVVDITNNDEFVDVLSASVEANSVYHVEGYCRSFTAVDSDLILSLPSGATFTGTYESFAGGASVSTFWDGTRLTGQSYGEGATIRFSGVVDTAGTAGNFKLRACQTVADPTTTEIPVGTYITITKAQ